MKEVKEIQPGQLPLVRGKTYILRILSIYKDLFRQKYGFVPTLPFGKFGIMLKRLMATHTELQVSALMIVFFNWKGVTGNDNIEEQRLLNVTHNSSWFFNSIDKYKVYLINVFGLDFNNEEVVRKFVSDYMMSIK
jgi:hypothetical protein